MPAYFDTGFSVRKPMWHGLGNVLDEYPADWAEARKLGGLEWEPTYLDLFVPRMIDNGEELPADAQLLEGGHATKEYDDEAAGTYRLVASHRQQVLVPVEGHRAIARDDTMEVLATPTDSFELIYHEQMGDLIEAYSEAWRKAGAEMKFETAGSCRGGRQVWAVVYLDEPFTIKGDTSETLPFATILNAHDGSGACKMLPTDVRVVCWNTWKMAEAQGDRTGQQLIIRHAGNVSERLESAKESLAGLRDESLAYRAMCDELASINVSDALVGMFIDEFIPVPENASERTRNNRAERQAQFRQLLNASPTNADLPQTAYKLVQAAGEWLDHLRPYRSQDTYLARTMLTPEPIKGRVIKLVRELAAEGV
jgi:phage/plasmid-like protein (TIGR03299 family)